MYAPLRATSWLLPLFLLAFAPVMTHATHVAGGTFNAYCLGEDPDSLGNQLYEVVIKMYRDCEGVPMDRTVNNDRLQGRNHDQPIPMLVHSSCGGTQEFVEIDDYELVELTQICESHIPYSSCNGGYLPGIQEATMKFYLSLSPDCNYEFEWWAPDRNANIRNLLDPRDHTMYWNAELNLTVDPCMELPEVKEKPVPFVCEGSHVKYNVMSELPGADGDSLRFSFTRAKAAEKLNGQNDEYTGDIYNLTYINGTSPSQPIRGITLDPLTGLIEFDAPREGWWDVTVNIDIYDRETGQYKGKKMFDFPFIVLGDCDNEVPDVPDDVANLNGPATNAANNIVAACDQGYFCFDLIFEDEDSGDNLTIVEHTLSQLPGATMNVTGFNPLTATICWTADSAYDGTIVSFTVRDDACPIYAENIYNFEIDIYCDLWLEVDFSGLDVCLGETTEFEASTGGTIEPENWLWDFGDGTQSNVQNPDHTYDAPGEYDVTLEVSSGNFVVDTSLIVTVYDLPSGTATAAPDSATCNERILGSITVDGIAPGDGQTLLYDIGDGPTENNVFADLGANTYYIDIITVPGGCVSTVEMLVPELSNTHIDTAYITPGDSVICIEATPYQLSATLPDGTWAGPGITDAIFGIFNPAVAGPGEHTISYNLNHPCAEGNSITIQVEEPATINAYEAGPFCITEGMAYLDAEASGVTWSGTGVTNAVLGSFEPSIAGVGRHEILAYIPGVCDAYDTLFIDVYPIAGTVIDPVDTVCVQSGDFLMTAQVAGGKWSGAGIVDRNDGLFSPADAGVGTHNVQYMMDSACATQAVQVVDVKGPLSLTLKSAGPFCSDANAVQLESNPAEEVEWTGNGVNDQGVFNPVVAGAGNHLVTVKRSDICDTYRSTVIQVQQKIIGDIVTPDPVCASEDTLMIYDKNGALGLWTGTAMSSNGLFNPSDVGQGVHEVYFRPYGNCYRMDTAEVTVLPVPDVAIDGPDAICTEAFPESFTSNYPGIWSGQGITDTINGIFDPAAAGVGIHVITYTSDEVCAEQATHNIQVQAPENVAITAVNPFCENDDAILLKANISGGVWSGNGILNQNVGIFDPATAGDGIHKITLTKTAVCVSTGTTAVEVMPIISSPITAPDSICIHAESLNLETDLTGGLWSGNGITQTDSGTFSPSRAGLGSHNVFYSPDTACAQPTVSIITVVGPEDVSITVATPICEDEPPFQLVSDPTDVWWSGTGITDSVNGIFNAQEAGPGFHAITATLEGICTSQATKEIQIIETVYGHVDSVPELCQYDGEVTLTATDQLGRWIGEDITIAGVINTTLLEAGEHQFVFLPNGVCAVEDTAEVFIIPAPPVSIISPDVICQGEDSVQLTVTDSGGVWSGTGIIDENFGTFSPLAAGIAYGQFVVQYRKGGKCPIVAQDTIKVQSVPEIAVDGGYFEGCAPLSVTMTIDQAQLNPSIIDYYAWDFDDGDGGFTNGGTEHTYDSAGSYYATLDFITTKGCIAKATDSVEVHVYPVPEASFEAIDLETLNVTDTSVFVNQSSLNDFNAWYINGELVGNESNLNHVFGIGGEHQVELVVTTEEGCMDTTAIIVDVYMAPTVHVPSAFSPNGDGLNDEFIPFVYGIVLEKSTLLIFDRWGDIIHRGAPGEPAEGKEAEYTSSELAWDGYYKGLPAKSDVYTYKLLYETVEKPGTLEKIGRVTLVR